jgi:hypothetical protein
MQSDNRPAQHGEQILYCKCGRVIATQTARRLSIGCASIYQPVELVCGHCQQKVFWGPQSAVKIQGRT